MTTPRIVRAYLGELARALVCGSAERNRILAEVEDHLVEAAEHLRAEGFSLEEAGGAAVERFGPPAEVAHRFLVVQRREAGTPVRFRTLAVSLAAAVLLVAAVGLHLVGVRWPGTERGKLQNPETAFTSGAFTAVRVVTVYDGSGSIHSVRASIDAFRSDGSNFSMSRGQAAATANAAWPAEIRSFEDRANRLSAMLVPARRLVSSHPMPGAVLQSDSHYPTKKCAWLLEALEKDPAAERDVLLGHEVIKHTYGAHSAHERWVAPGLDCYELRSTLWRTSPVTGERHAVQHTEVVFLSRGEPPAEYFNVPPGYRECPPSEIFRAVETEARRTIAPHAVESASQFHRSADERYYRLRAAAE